MNMKEKEDTFPCDRCGLDTAESQLLDGWNSVGEHEFICQECDTPGDQEERKIPLREWDRKNR